MWGFRFGLSSFILLYQLRLSGLTVDFFEHIIDFLVLFRLALHGTPLATAMGSLSFFKLGEVCCTEKSKARGVFRTFFRWRNSVIVTSSFFWLFDSRLRWRRGLSSRLQVALYHGTQIWQTLRLLATLGQHLTRYLKLSLTVSGKGRCHTFPRVWLLTVGTVRDLRTQRSGQRLFKMLNVSRFDAIKMIKFFERDNFNWGWMILFISGLHIAQLNFWVLNSGEVAVG